MKILYVNWAPLWLGAEIGGGVNVYSQAMAVAMAKKGHQVYSILAGASHNFAGGIYIKRAVDYKGIINYEIFNSPNIAPGFYNYHTPLADVEEPQVEQIFKEFLQFLKPDVVHFNNIEGFSANCVTIACNTNAHVIYSLHNYHPVCNQINLLYKSKEICHDFKNGTRCLDCISPPPKELQIRNHKLRHHIFMFSHGDLVWNLLKSLQRIIKTTKLSIKTILSIFNIRKERKKFINLPLENHPKLGEFSPKKNNINLEQGRLYQQRRQKIITAINQTNCVLAVSSWVKKIYIDMGIDEKIIHVCHIGNKMAEQQVKNKPIIKLDEPIKIIFLGVSDPIKGLYLILDALENLNNDILAKIDLYIYARGVYNYKGRLNSLNKRLANLSINDGYKFKELPQILNQMDIGIVPPIWWDNAPQVVFEMLAMQVPVIGAEIGGIPDFVKNGKNGLLFEPDNSVDLSKKIASIINDKSLIEYFRKNIKSMKTIAQHAIELENFYNS
jgi:glycosyltransferase involved in cell wall biosynthesis